MADEGGTERGRAPARVLLHGGPDGWHCVVVDGAGGERRRDLPGAGTRWSTGGRADPEPPWWRRRIAETAEGLREAVAERLTDTTFRTLGVEAVITWFAVDEPVEWEGLVTLREADPARFPGRVAPFVITLEPGRGALLPDASLLFSTQAADAWATLAAVADRCGTRPPKASLLCGWADHRSVRVGRGALALSTDRGEDGVERLAEICGTRSPGWAATRRCGSGWTASTCSTSPPTTWSRCCGNWGTGSSAVGGRSGWRTPASPCTAPTARASRSGRARPSGSRPYPCNYRPPSPPSESTPHPRLNLTALTRALPLSPHRAHTGPTRAAPEPHSGHTRLALGLAPGLI